MPTIRLSGTILGENDPARTDRAELLYLLFRSGWNIYNSNGDQRITLSNVEEKIIESDAFLFTPDPGIEDMFKAVSIFVGYQTLDKNLSGKPTILLNENETWQGLLDVLTHLNEVGTVSQDHREFLLEARSTGGAVKQLEYGCSRRPPDAGREQIEGVTVMDSFESSPPPSIVGNVCVFCSATMEDEGYLEDGRRLGEMLAENNFGCVSGAGKSGIMGAVVRGNVAAGGWSAGSNVPHIIEIEGLPEGLASFWLRDDIYTRMEVMIENSHAFIVMPGGAGSVQELLALMMFKANGDDLMEGKPVYIYNKSLPEGGGFWDPMIKLLETLCPEHPPIVCDDLEEILDSLVSRSGRAAVMTGTP